MKIPISAVAIFCEDIREEKSGGVSLIGIVGDNASVSPVAERSKAIMPKLCVYLRISFDSSSPPDSLSYKIILPDGTSVFQSPIEATVVAEAVTTREKGNPIATLVTRIVMSPFPITSLGIVRVVVTIGMEEYLAGTLNFVAGEPNANVQTIALPLPS